MKTSITGQHLTQKNKEELKALLLKIKEDLILDINKTQMRIKNSTEKPNDLNDVATIEENISFDLTTSSREYKLLLKIKNALNRIENSSNFGYCNLCKIFINFERLKLRPMAEYCVDCKQIIEEEERQFSK